MSVITSGKPPDLPSTSCPGFGLLVWPWPHDVASCLRLCPTAHVTLARQAQLVWLHLHFPIKHSWCGCICIFL